MRRRGPVVVMLHLRNQRCAPIITIGFRVVPAAASALSSACGPHRATSDGCLKPSWCYRGAVLVAVRPLVTSLRGRTVVELLTRVRIRLRWRSRAVVHASGGGHRRRAQCRRRLGPRQELAELGGLRAKRPYRVLLSKLRREEVIVAKRERCAGIGETDPASHARAR